MMFSTILILVVLAAAAPIAWRLGRRGLGFLFGAVAVLPAITLARQVPIWVLVALAALAVVFGVHHMSRTSATVTRWGSRIRRKVGVASTLDILRVGSALAMRRKAATVRPSLRAGGRVERAGQLAGVGLPACEVAVQLCRVGFLRVWSSVEDVVLAFGGPRTGKTQWMAGRIIDAPGATLVTSTRTDLYDQTRRLRARRGPVFVFNAVGLAGLDSTITFDPLTGCADPVTAAERATDMLGAVSRGNSGDREFWEGQARRVLAALLHAAALDEGRSTMADVLSWVSNPDDAERQVTGLLRKSSVQAFRDDAGQFLTTNPKTRTSITSTIMPALGWLTSPAAAAAGGPSTTQFDVADLLVRRATVYLLGGEETQAAPLVCALTGHIAREARRLAATRPGGRLDPPLLLALDEAALISPVPLDRWSADMGGRGVTIVANFQSRAQMLDRYGDAKTAATINNSGGTVLFGGTRDRDDLNYWSHLSGDRDERITTTDLHGRVASRTTRRVPVLAPAQLANLPAGKVVVFRRGMPPVVGRAEQAWQRRDIRNLTAPESRWGRARCRALAALTNGARAARGGRPRRAARPMPDLDVPSVDLTPPRANGPTPGPWAASAWELPPGDGGPGRPDEPGSWN
jgi:type IV secretory pathway TraG/TraD family ATPase VirD4